MSGFEGGRQPCYIQDLIEALPDNGADAMTAEEIANKNHWYVAAVEDKLNELAGMIFRGNYNGIRLRLRGKVAKYWLDEVDEGSEKAAPPNLKLIRETELKPEMAEVSEPVKEKYDPPKKISASRYQDVFSALPRSMDDAISAKELAASTHATAQIVYQRLHDIRRILNKDGQIDGVHARLMETSRGKGKKYWVKITTDTEPEPVLEVDGNQLSESMQQFVDLLPRSRAEALTVLQLHELSGLTVSAIHNKLYQVRKALENNWYEGFHGRLCVHKVSIGSNPQTGNGPTTTVGHYWFEEDTSDHGETPTTPTDGAPEFKVEDPSETSAGLRTSSEDYDPPFDDIGLPGPEPVTVLKLTDLERATLLDMCYAALRTTPGHRAWFRVVDKLEGVAP